MAIVLASCVKECLAILNASSLNVTTAGPNSIDPKYPDDHVLAVVTDAATEFQAIVAKTKDHPDLTALLVDTTAQDSGTKLTTAVAPKVGEFASVRVSYASGTPAANTYRPSHPVPAIDVFRYTDDVTALGLTIPWYVYAIEGGYIYHPGTKAILAYVPSAIDVANIPAQYKNGIVAMALAILFPFMGDQGKIPAAQHFLGIAEEAKKLIAQGAPVPPVRPYTGG